MSELRVPPALRAALDALDPEQRAAVLAPEPSTLVRAQVGSGKTTVLVHRAAYLHLACGVPLEHVAIVTFTNRAAAELRTRLDALLGRATSDAECWLVGTFHGVASALLRRALPATGPGPTRRFTILDDEEALELAVSVARRLRVRPGRRATLRDRLRSDPALAELARAYAAERAARDAMDFDDLIEHATMRLTASPAAHVLVDELQDCEPRELAFLRRLVGPDTHCFAVGDPLQSIYGWRGATPALFARAGHGARIRVLPRSYRSTRTILAGARGVLGVQPADLGELVPVRGPGSIFSIVRHHDVTAEAAYLAARLVELHASGVAWRDIAVLCRLRAQVADLVAALATRGVPCVYDLDGVVEPTTPTEAGETAGVRVLTIHAAKGLEFTHVFVSGANVGVLPLLSRDPDAPPDRHADPAEERRLLFVALTRARDVVEISYHTSPHAYGAFGVASPLLALLPADVVTRTDGVAPSTASAPSPPPPVAEPGPREWHVGQRVRHARYGTGTITAIAGDTIDCDFGKLGARAFPRALCPLT